MVTVTLLSSPTSPNSIFGTSGSFGFICRRPGEVGGEPLNCGDLVLAELGPHEYVSQEREFSDRDCRTGARDTDCFVDDIFADGVSTFGAV